MIYVIRNGGSDHQIAPSKRVNIHTKKGIVKGVFGWPAIHTRNRGKEESASLHNIFIDVGCATKEEVENLGIHVGCVITYPDEFMVLNGDKFVCRALDNRMGGFMIAEVARLLKENKKKLPFGLYIVNSVQEEIGLRGAEMITQTLKPNVAIVTDVCHDTSTPMIEKKIEGDLQIGKGPVIAYAPAVQNKLRDLITDTATTCKIPFQRHATSRVTGTDTDAFAYSNGGLSDEVYEYITFEQTHISVHHRPKLWERSISISSFGKSFHITGWKIGYVIAPEHLMREIKKVHQFLVFSVSSIAQHALNEYIEVVDIKALGQFYQQKRDFFQSLMKDTKLKLLPCEGTYFQVASYAAISEENDIDFTKRLVTELGVATIPISIFYANGDDHQCIRFCFAKDEQTLTRAAERLRQL
ncbi:hypothetical protein NUACC21_00350 [Scytonema sp. NUACC21]